MLSKYPAAHAATTSRMGTAAAASAKKAALMQAQRVPPSACSTCWPGREESVQGGDEAAWHAGRPVICKREDGMPPPSPAPSQHLHPAPRAATRRATGHASPPAPHLHVDVKLRARHQLRHDRLLQRVADRLGDLGGAPVALAAPPPLACSPGSSGNWMANKQSMRRRRRR